MGIKEPTKKEIQEWKKKAAKWDELGDKIASFYPEEIGEKPDNGGDLTDIGEVAARAFGFL